MIIRGRHVPYPAKCCFRCRFALKPGEPKGRLGHCMMHAHRVFPDEVCEQFELRKKVKVDETHRAKRP